MNELVERLLKGSHPIEAIRPEKTVQALKECIDRGYVYIMFKKTGTELGIHLNMDYCNLEEVDFDGKKGNVHLEGGLILNYDKVKVVADINLKTLNGKGHLEPLNVEEYDRFMNKMPSEVGA